MQASALAPLSDLFRFSFLTGVAGMPVLQPHPADAAAAGVGTGSGSGTGTVAGAGAGAGKPTALSRLPGCFTTSALTGEDLNALLLVVSGSAQFTEVAATTAQPAGGKAHPVGAGEWLNASTVLRSSAPAGSASSVGGGGGGGGSVGDGAGAGARLEVSTRHASCGVYRLPAALVERFADALPRGQTRLRLWKMGSSGPPGNL